MYLAANTKYITLISKYRYENVQQLYNGTGNQIAIQIHHKITKTNKY